MTKSYKEDLDHCYEQSAWSEDFFRSIISSQALNKDKQRKILAIKSPDMLNEWGFKDRLHEKSASLQMGIGVINKPIFKKKLEIESASNTMGSRRIKSVIDIKRKVQLSKPLTHIRRNSSKQEIKVSFSKILSSSNNMKKESSIPKLDKIHLELSGMKFKILRSRTKQFFDHFRTSRLNECASSSSLIRQEPIFKIKALTPIDSVKKRTFKLGLPLHSNSNIQRQIKEILGAKRSHLKSCLKRKRSFIKVNNHNK